ncbi:MAG: glycosyltransferase family 2 protein [Muribaculaceae bacterium]|nr:glycosyltransferase family 2 protein [Muribaculaceae bacterium]
MKKITILIPVYNEGANLPALRDALRPLIDNRMTPVPYEWEVLMVNDGSLDNSAALMAQMRLDDDRFCDLNLSRNFGKELAMLAGMDYATGDAVVIMDADLQHPVSVIPQMIAEWEAGYQDVYGIRRSRATDSRVKRWMARKYYSILKKSSRMNVLPHVGDFRLLDRICVNAMRSLRETQRNTKGLFCWIGYKKKEVAFDYGKRNAGKSAYGFARLMELAVDGITSFTTAPLRFATYMGFISAIISLIYLIFIIIKTIFIGEPVQGFPTIMCTILFLGGCQLISIGIIGEYIGRIFKETKGRPPYLVDTFKGKPADSNKN